jgi:hypothetical protein
MVVGELVEEGRVKLDTRSAATAPAALSSASRQLSLAGSGEKVEEVRRRGRKWEVQR